MKPLHPWVAADPQRKYVKAEFTDIRQTFKAVRKKQMRDAEKRKRKEVRK